MATSTVHTLPGIWMRLIDRKRLKKLMAIQGVSNRELARAAGWQSHSYMNALLTDNPKYQKTTLEVEPAVRIAAYLGVGVDDLFMPRTASDTGQKGKARAA